MILEEITEHANLYLRFLVDSSQHDLMYYMNQYVFNKMYNTDFGNLVPLALANVLHVNIGIISKDVRDYNARVIHANASNDTLGNILIYKTPDHYDSIILKPVDTEYNSQVYGRYKQTGVSPTGRHHGPVSDSPRLCEIHRFFDGAALPDPPSTSGDNSMAPDNAISPDRATKVKGYDRTGTGDESITDTCRVSNELSIKQSPHFVPKNITVDMDMTQLSEMADESFVSEPKDFISDLKNLRYCNPRNVIIGHININSLRNKYDPIRSILHNGLCDIFTLSETKLDGSFPTAQFHITNFVLHRKDRNAHGGGIITYIRSDLPHRRRFDLEFNASTFEFIILEVQLYKKEKWFICSCYKPPSIKDSVFERSFSELLNSLQMESLHIFIIGDINFDMSKENTLSNLCTTYDLKNLVCGPTCSKGAKSTALDVILSSEPKRFKHTINEPCFLSDFHNVICTVTKLLCPPVVPKRVYYRSYKHFNEESYVRDLNSAPFMVCNIFGDPDDRAWCFTKVLSDVMEKNAPVKSKVIKKHQIPYMNSKLRKAMYKRNMLRNKYKKGLVEWDVYRMQRNITTSIYKKSQATYFSERCEGGAKNQKFWKTIKPFLTSKQPSSNNIILKEDDKIITDEREICDIF